AEPPGPARAGGLARVPGVPLVVLAPAAGLERGEDPAQRALPEPAHRLGGELEPAPGAPQVALGLQLPLDPPERLQVVHGRAPERAPDHLLVDVVEPGAGIVLAQRALQRVEVGELLERGD